MSECIFIFKKIFATLDAHTTTSSLDDDDDDDDGEKLKDFLTFINANERSYGFYYSSFSAVCEHDSENITGALIFLERFSFSLRPCRMLQLLRDITYALLYLGLPLIPSSRRFFIFSETRGKVKSRENEEMRGAQRAQER